MASLNRTDAVAGRSSAGAARAVAPPGAAGDGAAGRLGHRGGTACRRPGAGAQVGQEG